MTNGWVDIKNADVILAMGGNPAENHPVGFKWFIEAKKNRGAKLVAVDPRFTQTAAVADLYSPIRAGTDIAYLYGIIRYALEKKRFHEDYVKIHTNAPYIVSEKFAFNDGLFSGFDDAKKEYAKDSWAYEADETTKGYKVDPTMQHPKCVFQLLKKHVDRYTPEMVERICGTPKETFLKVAEMVTSTGNAERVGTVTYALGWTQHSTGVQIIRTAAMLQLLLGNVGRPGGGVNALRGHSNIQGATDMAGNTEILPGYLKVPTPADTDFNAYITRITPKASKPKEWDSFNYWSNTPKFAVSFLKAMYGSAATKENDWAYNYLPKIDRNYSWVNIWNDMYEGKVKGIFAFGMNGVMIGPDSNKNIDALKKADWLVVCEIYPDETSEFWRAPGITTDEMKQINT